MRNIFVAALLLSPMLLTSAAVASSPKTDSPVPTQNLRVSTGVIAPELSDPASIRLTAHEFDKVLPSEVAVVLAVNVDEHGNAHNVKVVKSVNPDFDARVVEAVNHSHFRPAKLDNQPIPFDLNLTVFVQH